MDFIERFVGISPDGGSGLTELTLIMAIVTAVLLVQRSSPVLRLLGRTRR